MTRYVTDTHALIWYLTRPARLGAGARQAFADADAGRAEVVVPIIVVVELAMIAAKSRIPGFTLAALREVVARIRAHPGYSLKSLDDEETIYQAASIANVRESFDRLLIAEAQGLGLPLITEDAEITASAAVAVVWDDTLPRA